MSYKWEEIFKILDLENCENDNNKIVIKVDHVEKNKRLDFTMKIVASLMKKYNEESEKKSASYEEKKELITQFENVMKAIRYEVMDLKDLFRNNKDNLELLLELSNSVALNEEFIKLVELYKQKTNNNIEVIVEKNLVPNEQCNIYLIEKEIHKKL